MQDTLMQQGLELLLFGMGTVFFFLTLLVIVTSAMSQLVLRYAPAPVVQERRSPVVSSPEAIPTTIADDTQLVAVISAAIQQYRSRHKSQ